MTRHTEDGRAERVVKIFTYMLKNSQREHTARKVFLYLYDREPANPADIRHIQRDLQELQYANPEFIEHEKQGAALIYQIKTDFRGKVNWPIERNEALGFFLLKRLQRFFAPGSKNFKDLENAIVDKMDATDVELFNDLDDKLEQSVHVYGETTMLSLDNDLLNKVLTALVRRRRMSVMYFRGGDTKSQKRTFCPVKLVVSRGELYLVCCDETREDRNYYIKLCRIESAELLEETFSIKPERLAFIEKGLENSFGLLDNFEDKPEKIRLKFTPAMKRLLMERRYHRTQQVTEDKRGNIILTLTVPVGFELVQWVLSMDDSVTVLQPQTLKDRMREIGDRLIEKYGKKRRPGQR